MDRLTVVCNFLVTLDDLADDQALCALAEVAARLVVDEEHPGFAARDLVLLAMTQLPSMIVPGDTSVTAMYRYTLLKAPLCA